ncbi:hypothetical protein BGX23_005945 [Mortierella sp. AD031]|nr:hypothetical protein BGX23_005945 [Mortierella sp. AD031]
MVDSPNTMPSYFDIAKPVSIPTNASAQYSHGFSSMLANQDMDEDALPEYLQSFQDSGISDARLKQFTWLHPKNYSSEGSKKEH